MKKLTDIRPQEQNANAHTQRGLGMLEKSIQEDGWIGAITVAADGETFDGSARVEVGVPAGFEDAIVIRSDGSKPIIHVREDIPSASDPRAKRLGVAANRIAQVDYAPDASVLAGIAEEGVDLSGMYFPHEWAALLDQAGTEILDANALWKGMPEFEHEDKTAYKSIVLHFKDQAAVDTFAALVGQNITLNTRYLWYPEKEIETYMDKRYAPES